MNETEDCKLIRWWKGKMCRPKCVPDSVPLKIVSDVLLHGPPSRVYYFAELVYADGTSAMVVPIGRHKPSKSDVICEENKEK